MRLTSSFVCLAAAAVLTACGSKYVQGGRPDTGERINVIVENQAERFATVSFSWQRDQPFPLGRVESGSEETWETTWQDLPFRPHVPVIFAGAGIDSGIVRRRIEPADVAPTLAALLGMSPPASAQGRVLPEVLRAR